jgi:hypothetical protein
MACGHAQILDQSFVEPRGGVLALVGAEDKAMEDAEQKMAAHCGAGKFRVERRTMAVTGISTVSTTQTDYGEQENDQGEQRERSGGETQSTITESQETRELRISYACTQ